MTKELTIDPEFRDFLPPLDEESRQSLEEAIATDGCRDPIVVWANHDDTIIDGHNRYELCQKHDKPFKTVALRFDSRSEVLAWIWDNQRARRNMTPQELRLIRAKMYEAAKAETPNPEGKNQHSPEEAENEAPAKKGAKTPGKTQEEVKGQNDLKPNAAARTVAEKTGVSEKTVRRDAEYKAALDSVVQFARDRIVSNKLKASTDDLKHLAELAPQEQRAVVDSVSGGVAKSIKAALNEREPKEPKTESTSIVKDAIEREVPANLREPHASGAAIQAEARKLDPIRRAVESLAEQPGGEFLPVSEIGELLKQVKGKISQARYWSECPRCQGKPKAKCDRCSGHGFIPFSRRGMLSAEDKAWLGAE